MSPNPNRPSPPSRLIFAFDSNLRPYYSNRFVRSPKRDTVIIEMRFELSNMIGLIRVPVRPTTLGDREVCQSTVNLTAL